MANLLLAKPVVASLQERIKERVKHVQQTQKRSPKLAVILVGENPASVIYTRKKGETAVALGMEHETIRFDGDASPAEVKSAVDRLNADLSVDGILIQRPLPSSFREEEVLFWIAPEKDVDAFHPINTGRLVLGLPCFKPCTPAGIMALLKYYKICPSGKVACIIGRSSIVGKPMAALLLQENATVIHCHSKTPDMRSFTKQAELLIVAIGRPEMIDASYIRPGSVVIDVGISRTDQGKVVGDVAFASAEKVASAITPVPGGVGPMTIATLLENTVWAAELRF